MSGWSVVFGSIFSNSNTAAKVHIITKTATFRSLCGGFYVDFDEGDAYYLQEIKTPRGTIVHRGIEFEYVKTSIR